MILLFAPPLRCRAVPLSLLTILACTDPVPATVYVPARDYQQSLSIGFDGDSSGGIRAGQWVVLHARRATGPWNAVPRAQANLTDCWWRRPPPPVESEVANNVTWHVLPSDSALFNLPSGPEAERRLRLVRSGHYLLWAASHGCSQPVISDTVVLEVVP